ncbi:MAG: RagB/SusD family nutrient uptake outer membrane protein [Lunatimonas sp.]|uniref:RagB/SusD family nutrient uptake outer membrane protein n=1 Tax=Lunatimonas sp. TaxID=2060141 RepID=UPI00263BCA0D|nr:RagB/SusD family nutrient uptake outer membrane protein [Lunatimonas sp.]MCC5936821.1 RagB/SusD family nutrient uptake outer membrane protein [Lunatimonas sp.]
MKKLIYQLILFLVVGVSCNVIDQEPLDAVSNEQLFVRPSDAEAAIIGVYRQLAELGFNYVVFPELPTKNTLGTALNRQFEQMNNLLFLDDNPWYETYWNQHFVLINRANVVIARVPEIPGMDEQKKNEVLGEARFLRAFVYFNLVRNYGDVPLITTPTTSPDIPSLQIARNPTAQVYSQIFEDLNFAKANLPESFSTALATKARATKNAAYALGTRIYLFRKEYAQAIQDANRVIGSKGSSLTVAYEALFSNKNSEESILEINYDPQVQNNLATNFLPGSLGGNRVIEVNPDIYNAYEVGDSRKDATFGFANNGNYMRKYFRTSSRDDNVIVFRLAEVLLSKAEALAETAFPNSEAVDLLNEVRRRAGLGPIAPPTIAAFREALYKERRLELCYEGHEWFDLVRTDRLASVMGITDRNKAILPVPAGEILRNPNLLPQNPGY